MTESELEYAGFWVRVGASIIDTILLLFFVIPLMLAFYGDSYWTDTSLIKGPVGLLVEWILPAVAVIAFWVAKQATPGKMALSMKIVDAKTGDRPSAGQLIGRYLGYFVSMLPLFLGILWVAFDRRKQGWHDKLAGTVVVRPKNSGPDEVRFGDA